MSPITRIDLEEQRRDWRRPHGHGLAGGMNEAESQEQRELERSRAQA